MKKIMFNDKYGLTEAVLEGRKTQTRRTISLKDGEYVVVTKLDDGEYMSYVAKDGNPTAHVGSLELPNFVRPLSPKCFIGEVVAVAQSMRDVYADFYKRMLKMDTSELLMKFGGIEPDFSNKMFVKAELMPHHIKITNIRVERLQDISDDDCLAEGIVYKDGRYYVQDNGNNGVWNGLDHAKDAYAFLIDKVSGKGSWESNPFVFVYDFELVD